MDAQKYIISQLDALKVPFAVDINPKNDAEMVYAILKFLFSKKFRKFSIPEKNQAIIIAAVEKNVVNKEPIQIVFPFGGYKLWRLEETPEADWAELFSIIYFVRWLKPVCALYPKGVNFTFWLDEVVITKLNNIPQSDLDEYRKSFESLLAFIEPWAPSNMRFETFLERSQYESDEAFEAGLQAEMEKLAQARVKDPKPLSESALRAIEMNVKLTPKQAEDPDWQKKVDLMHYAYYNLQEQQSRIRPSYTTENITAFTVFFEPNVIPIGSTKTSVAKFWVGVGALQKRGDSFIEAILSPSQIEKANFVWKPITMEGLEGKNFKRIRVFN
ncbi:MAG: hypothetical protein KG003_12885 [Bacteroidetes bacterium]|nr:hypothetical protein [Bacteroidota bacterium]